ncbi:MAG: sensor histidine kinase, partial [Anaerolineae bacterium]
MRQLTVSLTQFLNQQSPIRQISLALYILGGVGCVLFCILSILDGNWVNVATSGAVFLADIFVLFRFNTSETDDLFGILSVGALCALIIGTTFNFGINDAGLQAIYPILLMIGIAFRDKPTKIVGVGVLLIVWVLILFVFERGGFYASREEPFSLISKTVFIIFMILFMVMMLQVALQNLLAANLKLQVAKDKALAAKSVAEIANRAKSTFLAQMSHELRTPLNVIIGYSEIIAEDNDDETQQDAEKIRRSAINLLDILVSILEVTKIDPEGVQLNLQEVDVASVFDEVALLFRSEISQQNNLLTLQFDENVPTLVTDRQKFKQIVINLLKNANKFTQNGSIELRSYVQENEMIFAVQDTGVGISAESLGQIFNPFQQVENEYNRRFDGLGLGLAISQNLASALQGRLFVESEQAKG